MKRNRFVLLTLLLLFPLCAAMLQAASVIRFSASTYLVTEDTPQVAVVIQRANDLETVVGVDFSMTNLSATAGLDYLDVATNLTFAAGESNKLVVVAILNDGLVEAPETFRMLLTNPAGGALLGSLSNATVQIMDNDKGIQLEVSRYAANED